MVLGEYDAYVFDLDGTLVDVHEEYMYTLMEDVGDELGCEFSQTDVSSIWHGIGDRRSDVLGRNGLTEREFWEAFDRFDDPRTRAEQTFLYSDAEFIGGVDVPVGLVTHCPADKTRVVLDHLDIRDWFDAVVCCCEDVGWKPDPAPVRRALADLDRSDGEGVLLGDNHVDIGAAWNAGLDGVHVERHGPDRRRHCVLGDYRVRTLEELRAASTPEADRTASYARTD